MNTWQAHSIIGVIYVVSAGFVMTIFLVTGT